MVKQYDLLVRTRVDKAAHFSKGLVVENRKKKKKKSKNKRKYERTTPNIIFSSYLPTTPFIFIFKITLK